MSVPATDLLSPRELSRQSGWSEKIIRKLIAERRIRHVRRGNRFLIPQNAIDEFVQANMVEPEVDERGAK